MILICGHTQQEYMDMIVRFHGHLAPGLILGGIMVDRAMRDRTGGEFFDFLCETAVCLPDAVQILTPCTYGNGWLKVVDVGRFALTMFEKYSGCGIRVHVDVSRLSPYPEIRNWFMKLKPKNEQDRDILIAEILEAGDNVLGTTAVQVNQSLVGGKKSRPNALCPSCGEAYPSKDGEQCLACKGTVLYQ
jgi:formylmethanofuran dehydrogenase subunit E